MNLTQRHLPSEFSRLVEYVRSHPDDAPTIIQAILDQPAPLEDVLHRDLLLIARLVAECPDAAGDVVEQLLELLFGLARDGRWAWLRARLIDTLAALSFPPCIEPIQARCRAALRDSDGQVQPTAEALLQRQPTLLPATETALVALLGERGWSLRWAATKALLAERQHSPALLAALTAALRDPDKLVQQGAAEALAGQANLPTEAVDAFRCVLDGGRHPLRRTAKTDGRIRAAAVQALAKQTPPPTELVPILVRVLGDSDTQVRATAAGALLATGNAVALDTARTDPDWKVRLTVIQTAARLPELVLPGFDTLVAALPDPDWRVRLAAVRGLLQRLPLPEAVLAALCEALHDKDGTVRHAVAETLLAAGHAQDEALSTLLAQLAVTDLHQRHSAVQALGKYQALDARVVPALVATLALPLFTLRHAALQTLGHYGPPPDSALPLLHAALTDPDDRIRVAAAATLSDEETLVALLTDPSLPDFTRVPAANALGKLPTATVREVLQATIADNDPNVADAAWQALLQAQTRWESRT